MTGAGISTDSGIPDFRSRGGVWSTYKTVTLQEFIQDSEKRKYYWRYKADTIPSMLTAEPNPSHDAVAALDRSGKLLCLITQNIDGLHEKSGIRPEKIIRLHGTNREAVCLACGDIQPIEKLLELLPGSDYEPRCSECGGFIKPNTVSFGQNLNRDDLIAADKAARECDLFMALGSSLQVQPASSFVSIARDAGKPVVIINRDETVYDSIAEVSIHGSLSEILPEIIR